MSEAEFKLEPVALSYLAGGVSIIPVGSDKRPHNPSLPKDHDTGKPTWKPFQTTRATAEQVTTWVNTRGVTGVAGVGGAVSGGLLIIDFDIPRFYGAWMARVSQLADGLPVQRTGRDGGGFQVWLRCSNPGPNQVLAHLSAPDEPSGRKAAIETRGEGGYALMPGSLHPSGRRYEVISGDFANIPMVEQERADAMLQAARGLEEAPFAKKDQERAQRAKPKARRTTSTGAGVIAQWNAAVPIREMLAREGYTPCGDRFTRPGSNPMPGGVVILDDRLSFHHSTSDPLHDGHAHDSFSVLCELQHKGDTKAAIKAAAKELGIEFRAATGSGQTAVKTVTVGAVILEFAPVGKGSRLRVTARMPRDAAFTDTFDPSAAARRAAFVEAVSDRCIDVDAPALDAALQQIAVAPTDSNGASADGGEPSSENASVLDLVLDSGVELFHTPGGHDSEGFATIALEGHRETLAIGSKAFKRWMGKLCFERTGTAPAAQKLTDACNVLAGMAIHNGPEHEVHVRFAEREGCLYLDLANEQWQTVRISPSGWEVVSGDSVPIRFVRRRGLLALPAPVRGGSLDMLRDLVNLPDDAQWVLANSWMVGAFRVGRPMPILIVNGEHGSAKSTLCRMVRGLIDPNKAPLRSPPREERDLVIAAANSHVVAFDNLSGISDTLSDAICRLATGGGFGTRELYSDGDEKLFDSLRPVILNGIEEPASRPDALDRAVCITLPVMPEDRRCDEDDLWSRYYQRRPAILGALLDAVCVGLQRVAATRLATLPRMADFARWVVAAEPALPWRPGLFMESYQGNRAESNFQAVEQSVIGLPILALVRREGIWKGTAGDLLSRLEEKYTDERTRKDRRWPPNRKGMGTQLRRLAPSFRATGITVELPDRRSGHDRRRIITLGLSGTGRAAWSARSADPDSDVGAADSDGVGADHAHPNAAHPSPDADHAPPADNGPGTPGMLSAAHADHAARPDPTSTKRGRL